VDAAVLVVGDVVHQHGRIVVEVIEVRGAHELVGAVLAERDAEVAAVIDEFIQRDRDHLARLQHGGLVGPRWVAHHSAGRVLDVVLRVAHRRVGHVDVCHGGHGPSSDDDEQGGECKA
jgi:hypothetical protein